MSKIKKQTKIKNVKYGNIDIPIIGSKSDLVPKIYNHIDIPVNIMDSLAISIINNFNILLIGETGTGKTSLIRELAYLRQQPLIIANMNGTISTDDLIGTKSIKNGSTYFENGIITTAMQEGYILCLDEINACPQEALFIIHGLTGIDQSITLPNGDVIRPHKDFRLTATMNENYAGTRALNIATKGRFTTVWDIKTLDPKQETDLLVKTTGIDEAIATDLVIVASQARKNNQEEKIMGYISTRALLNTANFIKAGLDLKTSYTACITNQGMNNEERTILDDLFALQFGSGSTAKQDPTIFVKQSEIDKLKQNNDEEYQRFIKTNEELQKVKTEFDTYKSNSINTPIVTDLQAKLEQANKKIDTLNTLRDYLDKKVITKP